MSHSSHRTARGVSSTHYGYYDQNNIWQVRTAPDSFVGNNRAEFWHNRAEFYDRHDEPNYEIW